MAQMASSNNCNSPTLSSLIQGLTSRAVNAFAATGGDPERSDFLAFIFLFFGFKICDGLRGGSSSDTYI